MSTSGCRSHIARGGRPSFEEACVDPFVIPGYLRQWRGEWGGADQFPSSIDAPHLGDMRPPGRSGFAVRTHTLAIGELDEPLDRLRGRSRWFLKHHGM